MDPCSPDLIGDARCIRFCAWQVGKLGFGFTIFTKKCQSNWIQVRKRFQPENSSTMGLGTVNSSAEQPIKWKSQETTRCWGTFTARLPSFLFSREIVVVCWQSSGNFICEVKTVKISSSLQNCCSSEVSAKHC